VVIRLVEPDASARVDVRPPKVVCFPRSASSQSLELDQPADVPSKEGKCGINHSIIDRLDGIGFAGSCPAFLESADGCDCLIDAGWNQFLGHSPLADSLDYAESSVALSPASVFANPLLTGGFDSQGAKLGDGLLPVQFEDRSHDDLHFDYFARTAVVTFGVFQVGNQHLCQHDPRVVAVLNAMRRCFHFQLQACERCARFCGVEWPRQEFLMPHARGVGPDGPGFSRLFVFEVWWCVFTASWPDAGSLGRTVEPFHSSPRSEAAPGTPRVSRNCFGSRVLREWR